MVDARSYADFLHQISEEMLERGRAARIAPELNGGDGLEPLSSRGYYRIETCGNTVLFYKFDRFLAVGLKGLAVIPVNQQSACYSHVQLHDKWLWGLLDFPPGIVMFAETD